MPSECTYLLVAERCLCRCRSGQHPSGKHQHPGMTLEGSRENLRALYTEADPAVLDRRNRSLRNACPLCQFILAQPLELPDDSYGLSNRHSDSLPRPTRSFHSTPPASTRSGGAAAASSSIGTDELAKIYTRVGDEWKMIAQTGLLEYEFVR